MREQGFLVSFIVLSYNSGSFIFQTLDSILNTELVDFEIIVADDGSSCFDKDQISDYLSERNSTNSFSFQLIHHVQNVGTVRNINIAILHSRGKYIKIIGGDDAYPKTNAVKNQIRFLENNSEYQGVVGFAQQCNKDLVPQNDVRMDIVNRNLRFLFSNCKQKVLKEYVRDEKLKFITQATCFRREFFDKFGLFDERLRLIEDMSMGIRIITTEVKISVIPEIVVLHRQEVGISDKERFLSVSRIQYYKDIVDCYKLFYIPNSFGLNKFHVVERYRVNLLRFELCKQKKNKDKKTKSIVTILKYFDSVLYYFFSKPREAIFKLTHLGHQ